MPTLAQPLVVVFAGNHGVVRHGVSAYPASVTQAMVANFAAGGAAINQICSSFDLGLKVVELDLDRPTEDFTQAPAMDEAATVADFARGMDAIAPGTDSALHRRNGDRQFDECGGHLSLRSTAARPPIGSAAAQASTIFV